jgi:hypothetical protein
MSKLLDVVRCGVAVEHPQHALDSPSLHFEVLN